MRATLVDWADRWVRASTTEQRLCGLSLDDPVVLVASAQGERWARLAGIEPIATVCPAPGMPWLTRRRIERTAERLGIREFAYSSPRVHTLSGRSLLQKAPAADQTRTGERDAMRRHLGLKDTDRLVVPMACHPTRIDQVPICMASAALAIAEFPVVFVLPARGANARRARAMLSNMDRVLEVIAWDGPTSSLARAADAILWGPDAEGRRPDSSDKAGIRWAIQFGVPVLCPESAIREEDAGRLVPCNGTGGADISSAVLSAFGNDVR